MQRCGSTSVEAQSCSPWALLLSDGSARIQHHLDPAHISLAQAGMDAENKSPELPEPGAAQCPPSATTSPSSAPGAPPSELMLLPPNSPQSNSLSSARSVGRLTALVALWEALLTALCPHKGGALGYSCKEQPLEPGKISLSCH